MFVKLLSLVLITFSVTLFLKVATCRPQMDYYQPIQPDSLVPIIDCAKIWNYAHYCGNYIDVSQHEVIRHLVVSNFVPLSAQVRDNCSLNIYSDNGLELVVNANTNWLWQCWSFATSAMCCECNFGECAGAEVPSGEDSCAIVYQQSQCLTCNGFRLEVKDKDEFGQLEIVDNQISSIMVKPGCKLSIYDEPDFQGNSETLINIAEYLPQEWDDNISSLKCFCDTDDVSHDTVAPTTTVLSTTPMTVYTTPDITSTIVTEPPTTITTSDPPIMTITTIPPTITSTEPPTTTIKTEPPITTVTTEPPTTTVTTESPTTTVTTEPPTTTVTTEPTITTVPTEPPTTTATTEPPTTTLTTESQTTAPTNEPTSTTTQPTTASVTTEISAVTCEIVKDCLY